MDNACILWIDLEQQPSGADVCRELHALFRIRRVAGAQEIDSAIQQFHPHILCFSYDAPTSDGLVALQQTKLRHPSLPIVMVTAQHSEKLAVWALRSRVWDYFVRPVSASELMPTFQRLARLAPRAQTSRHSIFPAQPAPAAHAARTQPAVQHIEIHFPQRILLSSVARLCHLSPCAFSRLFHKEQGLSFRQFVLRYRIRRASELLENSALSISEIAYTVGFNDLSYFSRAFRRATGICPTHYRPKH